MLFILMHIIDSSEEHRLIELVIEGDELAFGKLYEAYYQLVFGSIYCKIAVPEIVQDLTHDTFILAWKNIKNLRNKGKFRPWLLAISKNLCARYFKEKAINVRHIAMEIQDGITISSPMDVSFYSAIKLLNKLPKRYKLATFLRIVEDMSYEDIARKLDISTTSARTRVHRALKMIKKRLK